MLKTRFGAVPEIEVKMPQPFAQVEQPGEPILVLHASRSAKIVKSYGQLSGGAGRHIVENGSCWLEQTKSSRPLELTFTELKV